MAPLLLFGAAIGGATMYLFDPANGRRRRARIQDGVTHAQTDAQGFIDAGTRDLRSRRDALIGRARSLVRRRKATDVVLAERVRSKLGRHVAHPGAVEVSVLDGEVTLRGSVFAHEHADLADAIEGVAGVKQVRDELDIFQAAGNISELDGAPRRRDDFRNEHWAPGPRLLATAGALTLGLYALHRHGLVRLMTFAAGTALFVRSTTNQPLRSLASANGASGIDIQKTIHIRAPIDQVYQFLANYENFPLFMRNVRGVQVLPDGRSHWVVAGPLNIPIEWDAFTLRSEPDSVIEWSTVVGSPVEHAGTVRLDAIGDSATRVHIRMSYSPPAGALGHAVAKLFGADPKSEMDEDLMRLKSALETGRASHDSAVRGQSVVAG